MFPLLNKKLFRSRCYGCMQEKVWFGSVLPMKSNVLFIVRRQFLLFYVEQLFLLRAVHGNLFVLNQWEI